MKRLFLFIILFIFASNNPVFPQNRADFQLFLGNTAIFKLNHFYDWQDWTSFVQVSPTNKYALLEFGPKFNFPGGSLKLRAGLKVSTSKQGAKYIDRQALVLFYKWKGFAFLSINKIKDIATNKPFHWSSDQYFFEHDLKYGRFGAHIETVWWGKNYKTFTGPSYSFPVGVGNLVIWPGWGNDKKNILVVEYNLSFK